MKKKIILILIAIIFIAIVVLIWRGTENSRARRLGGTMEVKLEQGHKFMNVTWKDDELWILTRPMKEGESAEKTPYVFKQKTNMGFKNGKVLLYEQNKD